MKSKILMATLCVGLVSQRWAVSQTDTNSVTTNQPAMTMNEAAPATQTAKSTAAEPTAAPESTPAVIATNLPASATASATASNAPAMNPPSVAPSSVEATNAMGGVNEMASTTNTNAAVTVLPIQFQDVPITTAIANLARLAGINYLLDPKIGYGQPDQNGQIKPEPTISVRWDNVSPRQALLAVLDNYNLQLVEDPRSKIARITIKNPNAPPPLVTRVIQLKYSSVSNMVIAIDSALTDKRSRVVPDTRTSQLVVVATEREQDAVDTLVNQLDKPTRQVLIETRFMEVSSSPSTSKGIDWAGTLSAQNVSFGNNVNQAGRYSTDYKTTQITSINNNTTNVSTILQEILGAPQTLAGPPNLLVDTMKGFNPTTAFLDADGVSAVLSFLNQDADAKTIATPRVVTLDNQTAHIQVTRAEPIFSTTAGTQGSPGGSQVAYTNLGTILDVTPRISANNYIWLNVVPEVSSDFGTVTRIVAGVENQADEFDIRKVDTQVMIPNANTLVMGGFIKDNTQNQYTKVPILGDIPVLGYAFRSEHKGLQKDNLLIFITPTILKDTDFQPTTTHFLQSSPLGPESPMNPKSAWNSAKPYDWSNPKNTDPYYDVASPAPFDTATTNNAAEPPVTQTTTTSPSP